VLAFVNGLIQHAEAKAATTLAASGVIGGVLYNLAENERHRSVAFSTSTITCGTFAVTAAGSAALALIPRLGTREEPTSLIYFYHIARKYAKAFGSARYVEELRALSENSDELLREIAAQIWANAHVARQKYRWSSRALVALLLAILALAAAAIAASVQNV
jgi:hypothetical protein